MQSLCDVAKNMACDAALWKQILEVNVKDCDVSCCFEDKCNGAGSSKAKLFITVILNHVSDFCRIFHSLRSISINKKA